MSQIGPHGHKNNTQEALEWARVAPVIKVTNDLGLFGVASDDAIRIARRIFSVQEQDYFIDNQDADALTGAILSFLDGYRHERLYVELLNEIGKGRNAAYVQLARQVVPKLHAAGVKVLVPSWGTGDFEWEQWLAWRNADWAGADGIALHAYWGLPKGTPYEQLFTPWNALRYRTYWRPGDGDPYLLVVTECGRDKRLNDAPGGNVGNGGYIADGLSAEEFSKEVRAYSDELRKNKVLGTLFTNGPDPVWQSYNADPVVEYLLPYSEGTVFPVLYPDERPVMPWEVYPSAVFKSIQNNFSAGGAKPKIIVLHGTSGLGDPYHWFNNPAARASADFWVPRLSGQKVVQYVKLGDTSWSNGPLVKPDLSVPFLAWLQKYQITHSPATGNTWTVSVEFEKAAGNRSGLTAWQISEGRKLIAWLSEQCAIPLDRNHVLGHYQFDSVNKKFCPGPMPWAELLTDYAQQAEANFWGPMWSAANWARAKSRITAAQQLYVQKIVIDDKKKAGVQ